MQIDEKNWDSQYMILRNRHRSNGSVGGLKDCLHFPRGENILVSDHITLNFNNKMFEIWNMNLQISVSVLT